MLITAKTANSESFLTVLLKKSPKFTMLIYKTHKTFDSKSNPKYLAVFKKEALFTLDPLIRENNKFCFKTGKLLLNSFSKI